MSAPAAPTIPPRPVRAKEAAVHGANKLPEMPPRPIPKRIEQSPGRNHYPHSPLNEMPDSLSRRRSRDVSDIETPARPPSVTLPSIGQEGSEYADLQYTPSHPQSTSAMEAAHQTRRVGDDMQLHAPRPSLPKETAKTQVEGVTKTTSQQAAALGIGKPNTPGLDDKEHAPMPLRAKSSFSRPDSPASNGDRRLSSAFVDEQGPAELGIRVPINPMLGDVQAPSPAPLGDSHPGTMGSHNGDFGRPRRHNRTKSGNLPPGSYGLHGHGAPAQSAFEKDWYEKHPDQLMHDEDHGHYHSTGSGRGEFAMSSEDLNRIVRSTAGRGTGLGTSGTTVSYPDEQIGYLASEQYVSKSNVTSPVQTPGGSSTLYKMHSNVSQPAIESPLRKTSFPADDYGQEQFSQTKDSVTGRSDEALDSEFDEDTVHVGQPKQHYNKVTGGQETIRETEEAQPYITHPTDDENNDYSVPILAADEVAREPSTENLQPAVPPQRRGSAYDDFYYGSGDNTPNLSRPGSRPGSIHGGSFPLSLSRFTSRHEEYDRQDLHTPLEDVDEYEPLFPDEDSKKKSVTMAERFKRPATLQHRFPSQDTWEDAPGSSMHVATVTTPDLTPLPKEKSEGPDPAKTFESPETEAARKEETSEADKKKLIPKEERLATSKFAPHLRDDMPTRPGLQPRFPSQDVWEDSPDSQYLTTTVSGSEDTLRSLEDKETSPIATSKPSIPPRPNKSRLGDGASSSQIHPSVPARPQKRAGPPVDAQLTNPATWSQAEKAPSPTEIKKVPSIPDRPKPQIPQRPNKNTSGDSLSKTISATSVGSTGSTETEKAAPVTSPPLSKAKPQVPPRPAAGSKIANLKGNFMSDLNSKLGLGPPKQKEPEPEEEKEMKPLEDARKGRARGPQRRAPAKSPSAADELAAKKAPGFSIASPKSLWHINNADGLLTVHSHGGVSSKPLPEASTEAKAATTNDEILSMPTEKIEQMAHSTPADAPYPAAAAEPPVQASDAVVSPVEKLKEQEQDPDSLSQQSTASTGAASGRTIHRVQAEEQAPSLSQTTTASSELSGSTLERKQTMPGAFDEDAPESGDLREDPTAERKTAGSGVEATKASLPLPATDEEKVQGGTTEDKDVNRMSAEEMVTGAGAVDTLKGEEGSTQAVAMGMEEGGEGVEGVEQA